MSRRDTARARRKLRRALRPSGIGWTRLPPVAALQRRTILDHGRWHHRQTGLLVISALERAELPDGSGFAPQWHVSVSHPGAAGHRASDEECELVVRAFGLPAAEEDNHHPGRARHFWCPINESKRVDCQCKDDEDVLIESDGYTWTNPVNATRAQCRGCEWERMSGEPCRIHSSWPGR